MGRADLGRAAVSEEGDGACGGLEQVVSSHWRVLVMVKEEEEPLAGARGEPRKQGQGTMDLRPPSRMKRKEGRPPGHKEDIIRGRDIIRGPANDETTGCGCVNRVRVVI